MDGVAFDARVRFAGRLTLAAAALLLLIGSCLFAASWIDVPPDSTCSAVIYPDSWWDRDQCRTIMTARAAIALAMIAAAGILGWLGTRRRPPRHAVAIGCLAVAAVVAIMFVNELVRSGGGA
jgi:hypothetical protein